MGWHVLLGAVESPKLRVHEAKLRLSADKFTILVYAAWIKK